MSERRPEADATPALGSLDELDLGRPRKPAPPPPSPPPRQGPWLLLAAAIVIAAAVILALAHWRESLGTRLMPPSDLNREVAAAQAALARGELSAPDGSGARELFMSVLARDPDHPAARAGLAQVRDASLLQTRAALDAGDATSARARLELARALAAPAADLDVLERDLQQLESSHADLDGLLARADAARAAGRLEQQPDGALALYSDVLRQWPQNPLALQGRREILASLLQRAGSALDSGDFAAAESLVAVVVAADPSHLDLPAMQARLGEAQSRRDQARASALAAAGTDLRAGRLDAAANAYLQLLAADPAQREARAGLDDAAAAMAARAVHLAADFEFDGADEAMQLALAWSPELPAVLAAGERIEAVRSRHAQRATPVDGDDFVRLLRRAEAAMRRGDLIDPPGDSAWDRLQAAAAIAPDDPQLQQAMAEYDRRARACFEDELASNRLSRAQACLDALAVRGSLEDLAGERRRLADRWLAFAEERLGANELALARRALQSVQQLDPSHPGLAVMQERLRRAGG